MDIRDLKVQVFDIQIEQEKLLLQIQPTQEKIQELDKKKAELVKQIKGSNEK